MDFSGRGSNRQKEKCALLLFVLTLYRSAPFEESDCVKLYDYNRYVTESTEKVIENSHNKVTAGIGVGACGICHRGRLT